MRQAVFTIAPHADFLGVLADRLIDGTLAPDEDRKNPFWLADCTVFLPTRRSRQALAEALMGRGQFMLPDIRTLGGEAGEEDAFLPPFEEVPAPGPVSPVERQLRLSRLVAAWAGTEDGKAAFSIPPSAAEILALAASLGELQDEFVTARADAGRLQGLIGVEQLAGQWQQTLKFVSIALDYWPGVLALEGRADRTSLQNRRLERLAQAVPVLFGDRPVIVAGSTGSVPASADLIAAIAGLRRGSIVLPGLDTGLGEDELDRLTDPATGEHGHPQFGLVQLLARLGTRPDAVTELAENGDDARTDFVRLALATADGTSAWRGKRPDDAEIAAALAKISVIAARTEDEEARAVALAARAALGAGKRVGIVTPDRNLGRRIGAELKRFGVVVDDPAGQPLFQSPVGRLVRQMLGLVESECAPTDVVALLRAPGLDLGLEDEARLALVDRLDMGLLRGRRHAPGLAGLRQAAGLGDELTDLLARLESGIAPLLRLRAEARVSPAQFAAALAESFAQLVREAIEGRAELEALLGEIAALPDEGVPFTPRRLADAFAVLSAGHEVRNLAPRRQDIAIWGRLEARLQSPDVMILCALNEERWPEVADPGPWLSRAMRIAAGLEPPERRQGLAAHDFEMGVGARECVLAYAARLDSGPALPSRYIQRLAALAEPRVWDAVTARGDAMVEAARALDDPGPPVPAREPVPNPPVALRPKKLSVTEIETLMRSPYDIYARHVLRLRSVARLGADIDAAERGTLVHAVFAQFFAKGGDPEAPGALAELMRLAETAFARLDPEQRDIWLSRLATAAQALLDFERGRAGRVTRRHVEIAGERHYALEGGSFVLTGRADRIDELRDGTLDILDFKTGALPDTGQMRELQAPQLPLEAAIAQAGQFAGVPGRPVSGLTYVKVGWGPDALVPKPFTGPKGMGMAEMVDEVEARLSAHVNALLFSRHVMASQVLPRPRQRFAGDYDHLARRAEWALAEGEEDGA